MKYEDLIFKFKNNELFVHKSNCAFLENLFEYLNYNIYHDDFKAIIYGKKMANSKTEQKVKHCYDAYMFLLLNPKTIFSETLLKKFYYLLFLKELETEIAIKMQSKYYAISNKPHLERIMEVHFYCYEIFDTVTDEDKFIISMLILNYLLYSYDLSTIRMFKEDFDEYKIVKNKFFEGETEIAISFIINLLSKQKLQPKEYYQKLKPITLNDIIECIRNEEQIIRKMYNVDSIIIFGSFAKKTYRIDSDIDFAIVYKDDMSYDEKMEKNKMLKEFLFYKFNRFIDTHEISKYMEENIIKGIIKHIKIL